MAFLIVLIILALPFIEIAVFIAVGDEIGVIPTLILTIATTIIGLKIVRAAGVKQLSQLQNNLRAGEPPIANLCHAALLAAAGFCLLIPGFVTDSVGLLLLIPPVRTGVSLWLLRLLSRAVKRGNARGGGTTIIIEGEAWENTPEREKPGSGGGPHSSPRRLPGRPANDDH